MSKNLFITIGVIAIVAIGLIFYLKNNGKKQEVIKIGAVLPLSGRGANYGISLKQGIDLAVSEINASGGINGIPLKVLYEDSQSEPKTGVNAFNKLVVTDNVPLVIGSLSSIILAIQPIADEKKVVLINSSAISPNICEKADNFLFSIMVNGATEAKFMAKEFQKQFPNEKIAVIYSNNSSGLDTKNEFVLELELLGNTNIHLESFELDATDFRIQLDKIKKSQSKYGYLIAFSSKEFADILKQSRELNLDIHWYSYSGIETKETLELAKDAANGVIYSYPKYTDSDTLYSDFQSKYNSKYKSWADIYTVTSYDGVHLIADVMKEYGTASSDIQKGLRSIGSFDGIFGNVDFSHDGKQFVEKDLLWKKIENNQYRIVE